MGKPSVDVADEKALLMREKCKGKPGHERKMTILLMRKPSVTWQGTWQMERNGKSFD